MILLITRDKHLRLISKLCDAFRGVYSQIWTCMEEYIKHKMVTWRKRITNGIYKNSCDINDQIYNVYKTFDLQFNAYIVLAVRLYMKWPFGNMRSCFQLCMNNGLVTNIHKRINFSVVMQIWQYSFNVQVTIRNISHVRRLRPNYSELTHSLSRFDKITHC